MQFERNLFKILLPLHNNLEPVMVNNLIKIRLALLTKHEWRRYLVYALYWIVVYQPIPIQRCCSHVFHTVQLNWDGNGWIKGNVGQTGFYRVNYEEKNWDALVEQLQYYHKVKKLWHWWVAVIWWQFYLKLQDQESIFQSFSKW